MKRYILIIISALVGIMVFSCSPLISETSNNDQPSISHKKEAAILTMNDMMVIKLAADYLKAHGEAVEFNETEMILHYEHKNTVTLPVVNGEHIEYSEEYLEVILYQNTDDKEKPCKACFTIYMTDDGKILGYNKG